MLTGTLSVVMNELSRLQLAAEIFFCFVAYLANLNTTQIKTLSSKMYQPTSVPHGVPSKSLI